MTPALVVVNPAAGGGRTARRWPAIRADLQRCGLDFSWHATAGPGHATALARAAARAGTPLVVAVGGDGTLNEVVNGVTDADRPLAAVGLVPTGRGRDACRNLGLPRDPRRAAEGLVAGAVRVADLGVLVWPDGHARYFVNAAGAGFDATVARRTAGRGGGRLAYLASLLVSLAAHHPYAAGIAWDGAPAWRGRLAVAVVANGARYGGGMPIAPPADPRDGALDLVVAGDIGRLGLLAWLPALYRGRHLAHPRVLHRRVAGVRLDAALPLHVDGEPAGSGPALARVCPGALRVVGAAPA